MIAVLDPAYFANPGAISEPSLRQDLDFILDFLKTTKAQLVAVDDYWKPLWGELIGPLERRFSRCRQQFSELRKLSIQRPLPELTEQSKVWGFVALFQQGAYGLGPPWPDRMSSAVLRLTTLREEIVLVTKPVLDRNITRHQSGHSVLDECTRWRLLVQPRTPTVIPIPCIHHLRHVHLPWTARYDRRLPGQEDDARYPFCPPMEWWKRDTAAVRTHTSKPAFIDQRGNGWARPNIEGGAGYHWDVYLSDEKLVRVIRQPQINVVEFGAPSSEGRPGAIHHQPKPMNDCGWNCLD